MMRSSRPRYQPRSIDLAIRSAALRPRAMSNRVSASCGISAIGRPARRAARTAATLESTQVLWVWTTSKSPAVSRRKRLSLGAIAQRAARVRSKLANSKPWRSTPAARSRARSGASRSADSGA